MSTLLDQIETHITVKLPVNILIRLSGNRTPPPMTIIFMTFPSFHNVFSLSPCILKQPQSIFEGAHLCIGFNKFPSLDYCCTVIHHHPATGAYTFSKSEMGFYVWVVCMHRHGTSCFKSHPRRLGNIQSIPYPRGLQQNKYREWESNLCPSASTGSQVQLTTPRLLHLTS